MIDQKYITKPALKYRKFCKVIVLGYALFIAFFWFLLLEKKSDEEMEGKKRRVNRTVCPFYSYEQMQFLRDEVLVEVKDIEQLVALGRETKACPYYGSRYAIPAAQVRCTQF